MRSSFSRTPVSFCCRQLPLLTRLCVVELQSSPPSHRFVLCLPQSTFHDTRSTSDSDYDPLLLASYSGPHVGSSLRSTVSELEFLTEQGGNEFLSRVPEHYHQPARSLDRFFGIPQPRLEIVARPACPLLRRCCPAGRPRIDRAERK